MRVHPTYLIHDAKTVRVLIENEISMMYAIKLNDYFSLSLRKTILKPAMNWGSGKGECGVGVTRNKTEPHCWQLAFWARP